MYYLHQVLLRSSYPDWIIKEQEKKPPTSIINLETGLEVKKNILISVPYVHCLIKEFRRIFHHTNVQVIFKSTNTKIHTCASQRKNPFTHQTEYCLQIVQSEESCSQSYTGRSSRCLGNKVKEHRSCVTSAILEMCILEIFNSLLWPNMPSDG